jgi:putative membrane protein
MKIIFCRSLLSATAIAASLVVGISIAQVQEQQPPQQQQRQQLQQQQQQRQLESRPAAQGNMTDAQLVACLLIGNGNEVAVARIAEQRSKNDEVRKFAKMMIDDHSKFIEKLRPFAGQYANIANQAGSATTTGRATTAQQARGGQIDLVELKQKLGQKCLASVRKELESKEGGKFDHCYVGQQIGAHMQMVDTLEVFQEYVSPQLRSVLEEGTTTAKEHLDHAKQLAEKMMDQHATTASRQERETRQD